MAEGPVKSTAWTGFVDRIRRIDHQQKVGSEGSPFSGDLSSVEGVVHELCHWVALDYTLPRVAPEIDIATITARVLKDDPRWVNANECVTIGAEIVVLAQSYPRWSAWHKARLLTYAQNSLETDAVHRVRDGRAGVTAYAKARLARADQTRRARRVAAAVLRAIRTVDL